MDVEDAARLGADGLRRAGYELLHRLGTGGMGEVWAAARIGIEGAVKPCAIKVIRPEHAEDARYRRLFVAEGRLAMMLGHSNIVSVFDVGAVGRRLYMAMEWVDGVDLGTFRRRAQRSNRGQPLSIAEAAHVTGALLDALGYAHGFRIAGHEHGIVHRDISPRNVMITSHGEIKLMDFGLAGLALMGEGTGPRFRGTLRYLSREQARGRPEPASDLFAVGAILHELLDGRKFRHPHREEGALVASIFEEGIPPLDRRIPDVLEELRRGLLEPRAELRFRTAQRALTTLASWPGHRNRRLQLETRYRQCFGVPHSGLTGLLSMGGLGERLDELLRRRDREAALAARLREGQSTAPWVAGDSASARGVTPTSADEVGSILRPRPPERAMAHRAATPAGPPDDAADELDQEITEPWSGPPPAEDELGDSAMA
ncbi:MAG: serine/threonine protein kinase [Myxococcales bacterium]|nr:serine/threonine protein kinase [Myxococcales bacterium]MCB9715650.1 serine/threonine protein kinase [Myxococcales bacterium]